MVKMNYHKATGQTEKEQGVFGLKIILKKDYDELVRCQTKFYKVVSCHRWFAGWRDLDIIWDYIMQDTNFGGIERARKDYAKARGTDEYGKVLDSVENKS